MTTGSPPNAGHGKGWQAALMVVNQADFMTALAGPPDVVAPTWLGTRIRRRNCSGLCNARPDRLCRSLRIHGNWHRMQFAARLCAEAKDGQILGSVEATTPLEEVGELALKGLTQPVVAHNVPLAATQPALRVIEGGPQSV
jgi:hypothetical protein